MNTNLRKFPLIILAGGLGTRIAEETKLVPKPMIKIGGIPIILHIMNYYSKYGVIDFIICAGYKKQIIQNFFKNFLLDTSLSNFYFKNKKLLSLNQNFKKLKIKIVNTGLRTMTGGRIKKISKYVKNENFFMTYGDGLSNVSLFSLTNLHLKKNKIATVTAIKPTSRFGYLKINSKNKLVKNFQEKPINNDWINGGYFLLNKKIFKYIPKSKTIFEKEPLEKLARNKQLVAHKHNGFWHPMDTLRDKKYLEKIWKKKNVPWE